jgi:hypothetical protein
MYETLTKREISLWYGPIGSESYTTVIHTIGRLSIMPLGRRPAREKHTSAPPFEYAPSDIISALKDINFDCEENRLLAMDIIAKIENNTIQKGEHDG